MSPISLLTICLAAVIVAVAADQSELIGQFDESVDTRVINGKLAGRDQFPWEATVFVRRSDRWIFCSGALLSRNTVLTHADCLVRGEPTNVLLGSNTFNSGLRVQVPRYTVHPRYNTNNNRNQFFNIAVLRLAQLVTLSRSIQTIALPPIRYDHFAFEQLPARFAGFGTNCKYSAIHRPCARSISLDR